MANEFAQGPFRFTPGSTLRLNGAPMRRWVLSYGAEELAFDTLPEGATQSDVREAFADKIAGWANTAKGAAAGTVFELVTPAGDVLARVRLDNYPEGTAGCMPDDRYPFWLMTAARPRYGLPVTLREFADITASLATPARGWVANLLPDDVLTQNPAAWRAPTAWEIRHIVGEGSLTGITGAAAAALVGISPQNFRKYLAAEGASARQSISYATWHMLLHKLDVQRLTAASAG